MSSRSYDRFLAPRGALSSSFSLFRGSLLAALGLATAACGSGSTSSGTSGDTGTAGSGGVAGSGGAGASGGTAGAGGTAGEGGTAGAGGLGGGGGTAGAGGGTGGAGASGGAGGGAGDCVDPKPVLQPNGADSGFVKCADGAINRVSKATCDTSTAACLGTEMFMACTSDAQCNAKPGGRCTSLSTVGFGGEQTTCDCLYPCAGDSDCAGGVCACKGVIDQVASQCLTPAGCGGPGDCASGECGLSVYNDGCSTVAELLCREDTDVCHGSADCPPEASQCVSAYDNPGQFACAGEACVIGRPLVAEGTLRFAQPVSRADWQGAPLALDAGSLPEDVRAALAASFTEMAAFEHASIGRFARFTLELLALGAPPDLLILTQQAMADETAHAQLAYSLAGACGGRPVGPGPLAVKGVVPATETRAIVRALVQEACVGETVAAAEALALSQIVEDGALRAFWARIAADEARHAELGWRALSWMLAGAAPALRDLAAEAFTRAMEAVEGELPAAPAPALVSPEHGLLSPEALGALRRKAVRDVVEPCARALLAAPAVETVRSRLDDGARVR